MKRTILIVDDEADFVEMLTMRLEAHGYDVISAGDGEAGLGKAIADQPGLILLDVNMPVMDGFAALRRMRRDEGVSHIPVIMLTSRGDLQSVYRAQQMGAADYFIKPCDSDRFLKMVEGYVGRSSGSI